MKTTTYTPTPKRLEISRNLTAREYLNEWTQRASKENYDFVVFSIGSHKQTSQQIPKFTSALKKVAILNMDQAFTDNELTSVSTSTEVSVNYLTCKIKCNPKFLLVDPKSISSEPKDRMLKCDIPQENLITSILELIKSDKKVILLSHISISAPIIFFDSVLKNEAILGNYGNKFLFIHSYFTQLPTVLCSKEFIKYIISEKTNEKSLIELMSKVYDPKSDKMDDLYNSKILSNLSTTEAEDITALMEKDVTISGSINDSLFDL